jgi:ribosomal protein L23
MLSEKTYKQILSPLISEKSAIQKSVSNTYVFKVNKDATKTEIKKATEEINLENPFK